MKNKVKKIGKISKRKTDKERFFEEVGLIGKMFGTIARMTLDPNKLKKNKKK